MVKMVDSTFFFLLFIWWILGVQGQFNVQVQVGVEGSFYTPGTVSAGMNDIVTFVFGGDFHDVTQSSFENPCVPLPGGFSSGFAGRGSDFSGPTPVWNLKVTNVSGPLWFFCAATEPTFHCASGMVGAINPPSQEIYSSFVAAAKNTSPTATVAVSYVPNGVGAFATLSPAPVSSSVSVQPTIATSSPTNPAPSPSATASPASSGSNESHILGPAVGGAVGGAVAIGGFIIILLLIRRNSQRRTEPQVIPYTVDRVYDGYERAGIGSPGSPPLTGMSERSKTSGKDGYITQSLGYYGPDNRGETNRYNDAHPSHNVPRQYPSSGALQPVRMPTEAGLQAQTQIPRHPYAMNGSFDQDRDEDFTRSPGGDSEVPANLNILAKEVAKVLLQTTPPSSSGGDNVIPVEDGSDGGRGRRLNTQASREKMRGIHNEVNYSELAVENASRETHSTAPPLYRSYERQ